MLRRPLFLITFLAAMAVGAENLPVVPEMPVYFTFQADGDRYSFNGGFSVKADPAVVWGVLTDYNHYNHFISNIHAHVQKRMGNDLFLDQTAGGGFLFIQLNLHARLYVNEVPNVSMTFQDLEHKHFTYYQGEWKIQPPAPDGTIAITYGLEAERNKKTPDFLTAELFGESSGDLLTEMKKEMIKRQVKKDKELLKTPVAQTPTPIATPTN
jgi:hypothetical protein